MHLSFMPIRRTKVLRAFAFALYNEWNYLYEVKS